MAGGAKLSWALAYPGALAPGTTSAFPHTPALVLYLQVADDLHYPRVLVHHTHYATLLYIVDPWLPRPSLLPRFHFSTPHLPAAAHNRCPFSVPVALSTFDLPPPPSSPASNGFSASFLPLFASARTSQCQALSFLLDTLKISILSYYFFFIYFWRLTYMTIAASTNSRKRRATYTHTPTHTHTHTHILTPTHVAPDFWVLAFWPFPRDFPTPGRSQRSTGRLLSTPARMNPSCARGLGSHPNSF